MLRHYSRHGLRWLRMIANQRKANNRGTSCAIAVESSQSSLALPPGEKKLWPSQVKKSEVNFTGKSRRPLSPSPRLISAGVA
ncbi:hypothetical protein FAX15_20195 [Escherichia coli]|nr:hypothetical protein FAX15_20195 [Escherichia coli]